MRRLYDSTTARDCPPDGDLYGGYLDGTYKWADADWAYWAAKGKKVVRIAIQTTTLDADVLDVEMGNQDATGAVPWIRAKWLAGGVPTVYCFSDGGPTGYRISDVRAACDAASVKRPLFWVAQWDNDPATFDPTGDPEVVAKQYAGSAQTGGHYDASVVADFWPGVDVAQQFVTKEDVLALLGVYGLTDQYKFPALVNETEALYHIQHVHPEPPNLTGPRIIVPFVGAKWFGSDATFTRIGWTDANGVTAYYDQDGTKIA